MMIKTTIGIACLALCAASPAFAVTVTNQDSQSHTLVVDRGATESQQDLAAGAAVTVNCPSMCGFRDDAYGYSRLAGGDAKLVIDKHALLHFVGGHGDLTFGSSDHHA